MKHTAVVTVDVNEMQPTADGRGTKSVKVGEKRWVVELDLDLNGLVRELGPKACRSKRGCSRAVRGLVRVKRLEEVIPDKGRDLLVSPVNQVSATGK